MTKRLEASALATVGLVGASLWLFISIAEEGEMDVRFPSMSLDGKPLPLPPIHFAPRTHLQVAAPLQC